MKTQCPHCKAKFNVPDEYKGKKVKCLKCQESFICVEFETTTIPATTPKAPIEVTEKCKNCGRNIGELEKTYILNGNVVCTQCNEIILPPVGVSSQRPIYVAPTKGTSGFGIASLSLGIIACLGCWIPICGFATLPLAAIGFLFGFIGIIVSKTTGRSFASLPIAGTVVSVVAAFIFIFVTGVMTAAITESIDSVNKSLEEPYIEGSATQATYGGETEKAREKDEKEAYINNVKIVNPRVGKTVLNDWGIFGEIKNTGNRTLSEVEIKVFYLDEYGKAIYEDTFHPVLTSRWSSNNKPLKPNYSEKFGYEADDVPSEWKQKVIVQITNIEFAD